MSYKRTQSGIFGPGRLGNRRVLPPIDFITQEAARIEALLQESLQFKLGLKTGDQSPIDADPKLGSLNRFGRQMTTQMMRSNNCFRGYKVEIKGHTIKPSILFTAGTLYETFDYSNTSPLFGIKLLDIGCGALSAYLEPNETDDLLTQFLNDSPPIGAEVLQILGADVTGIDPRRNAKEEYEYQVAYKHKVMEYNQIRDWVPTVETKFDVIACLNVFSKSEFVYHYHQPKHIAAFLKDLHRIMAPEGLLYSDAPLMPSSRENKETNHRVFAMAGFRVIYEGYYYILEPVQHGSALAL